jgi:hypothetical protein
MNAPFKIKTDPVSSRTPAAIAIGPAKLDRQFDPSEYAPMAKDRSLDMILRATCAPTSLAKTTQLAHLVVTFLETLVPVRAAALALTRPIRIGARVIELRWLAERTARGELPVRNDAPSRHGDHQ